MSKVSTHTLECAFRIIECSVDISHYMRYIFNYIPKWKSKMSFHKRVHMCYSKVLYKCDEVSFSLPSHRSNIASSSFRVYPRGWWLVYDGVHNAIEILRNNLICQERKMTGKLLSCTFDFNKIVSRSEKGNWENDFSHRLYFPIIL